MQVEIMELPKHSTDEMVTFLHGALLGTANSVSDVVRFTTGDLMSAALHLIVDAGLENASPEQLRADIVKGLDAILADRAEERRKAN